jgi:hypothetical protein
MPVLPSRACSKAFDLSRLVGLMIINIRINVGKGKHLFEKLRCGG